MARQIRPRRIDWPTVFWRRAAGSLADCDLLCRSCDGRGCSLGREDVGEGTTIEDVLCRSCRGSGLLVPARELGSIDAALAADEAGGAWIDFVGHAGDGLVWPLPWKWTVNGRRFSIRRDLYHADEDVTAFMVNRNLVVGLFRIQADSRRHLEHIFRMACGEDAEMPTFVMPRLAR